MTQVRPAGAAVLRLEELAVAVVDERREVPHGANDHVPASTAVAAVRAAVGHEPLTAERDFSVASAAACDVDDDLVNHGVAHIF